MCSDSITCAAEVEVELGQCLILLAPAWFEREDFLDWRQGKLGNDWCPPACWLPNQRNGDYTDVFLVFDRRWNFDNLPNEPGQEHLWEGSDAATLPEDIFNAIGQILHERNLSYGVLWIKPA